MMEIHNGYCPFKSNHEMDIQCYEDCQLYDEENGCCIFVRMTLELEKIRKGLKK